MQGSLRVVRFLGDCANVATVSEYAVYRKDWVLHGADYHQVLFTIKIDYHS